MFLLYIDIDNDNNKIIIDKIEEKKINERREQREGSCYKNQLSSLQFRS